MTCLHHNGVGCFDQPALSSCIYTNLGTVEYGYSIRGEDGEGGRLFGLLHIARSVLR